MRKKLIAFICVAMIGVMLGGPPAWAASTGQTEPEPEPSKIKSSAVEVKAASYEGVVTFDASAAGFGTMTHTFTNGDEPIGNQGLYDVGVFVDKRYFVGWSNVNDYATNDAARFYFADAKVSQVFPNGLVGGETLYAVYVGGMDFFEIERTGRIDINKEGTAETTVPNGDIAGQSGFGTEYVDKDAQVYYESGINKYQLNLDTSFEFNKLLQSLVYLNPGGIMTNSNLSYEGPKYQANYSHVDLHIELDERHFFHQLPISTKPDYGRKL